MLAGVNEDGLNFRMALDLAHQGSDFGEIGASADDIIIFSGMCLNLLVRIGDRP